MIHPIQLLCGVHKYLTEKKDVFKAYSRAFTADCLTMGQSGEIQGIADTITVMLEDAHDFESVGNIETRDAIIAKVISRLEDAGLEFGPDTGFGPPKSLRELQGRS